MEAVSSFRAHVGVILNVTPDHMDRYPSLAAYARAKLNLLNNQGASDFAVLNREDRLLRGPGRTSAARRFWFSTRAPVDQGSCLQGDTLVFSDRGDGSRWSGWRPSGSRGFTTWENVAAAVTVARLLGASVQSIRETVARFRGVSHRLEWVREIRGIAFIKRLQGYQSGSAQRGLGGVRAADSDCGRATKPAILSVLSPLVSRRVKGLVLLGEASRKIQSQLAGTAPMTRAASMEEAVSLAFGQADPGEVVLLAPACASFDMFRDYEDRGNVFKEAVQRLQ